MLVGDAIYVGDAMLSWRCNLSLRSQGNTSEQQSSFSCTAAVRRTSTTVRDMRGPKIKRRSSSEEVGMLTTEIHQKPAGLLWLTWCSKGKFVLL